MAKITKYQIRLPVNVSQQSQGDKLFFFYLAFFSDIIVNRTIQIVPNVCVRHDFRPAPAYSNKPPYLPLPALLDLSVLLCLTEWKALARRGKQKAGRRRLVVSNMLGWK